MKVKKHWILVMIGFLLISSFLGGCGLQMAKTRNNLNKLEVGMTKDQVIQIMGKPYKREAYGQTEWLLYWTEAYPLTLDEGLTPIAIQDDKVIGWGRNFYRETPREYDIKIDQTIRQK